jgi:hypothetical protein
MPDWAMMVLCSLFGGAGVTMIADFLRYLRDRSRAKAKAVETTTQTQADLSMAFTDDQRSLLAEMRLERQAMVSERENLFQQMKTLGHEVTCLHHKVLTMSTLANTSIQGLRTHIRLIAELINHLPDEKRDQVASYLKASEEEADRHTEALHELLRRSAAGVPPVVAPNPLG